MSTGSWGRLPGPAPPQRPPLKLLPPPPPPPGAARALPLPLLEGGGREEDGCVLPPTGRAVPPGSLLNVHPQPLIRERRRRGFPSAGLRTGNSHEGGARAGSSAAGRRGV